MFEKTTTFLIMWSNDSPPANRRNFVQRNEDGQDPFKYIYFVKDTISPWLLVFLWSFLMLLGLYALFEHEYKLWNINVYNKTVDFSIPQNTNVL